MFSLCSETVAYLFFVFHMLSSKTRIFFGFALYIQFFWLDGQGWAEAREHACTIDGHSLASSLVFVRSCIINHEILKFSSINVSVFEIID